MKQRGFLTAVYMGRTDDQFENAEVYRLAYKLDGDRITVQSALGDKLEYDRLQYFREDWDMNSDLIRQASRDANPELGDSDVTT